MKSIKGVHGDKMIEVRVRFWTNNISKKKGRLVPRECWDAGTIAMDTNKLHGIKSKTPKGFGSLTGMVKVMEAVLTGHGVKLHMSGQNRRLYKTK